MAERKPLIMLVADLCIESAIEGLFSRPEALRIRPVDPRIEVHPGNDPGCLNRAADSLRSSTELFDHALVVFDHDGCGREEDTPSRIEDDVTEELRRTGWGNRAETLVIQPEVEAWVWSDSPEVKRSLGWSGSMRNLRAWLAQQGLWDEGEEKPFDPKPAMKAVLRQTGKPFSSTVFGELARNVSVNRCSDRSFLRLKSILQSWFGQHWT